MNPAGAMAAAGWGPGAIAMVAVIATVGALLIHWFTWRGQARRSFDTAPPAPAQRPVAAKPLSLPEVQAAMRAMAMRMDIEERLLPLVALPSGADGDFIYRDERGYAYCGFERGSRHFEYRATELDDLLYLVFRDRAWTASYLSLIGQDMPPEEHARRLGQGQMDLLAKGNARWAERLAHENAAASGEMA